MTRSFDITDVPMVSADSMEAIVDLVVSRGHARTFFNGHVADLRVEVEREFWARFDGPTAEGVATLVRFWALVDTMGARRVSRLLFAEGFAVLKPLARCAATLRLNVSWGFAPQRLLWAVTEAQARLPASRMGRPAHVAGPRADERDTALLAA